MWGQEPEHRTGQTDALNQGFRPEKACATGLAGATERWASETWEPAVLEVGASVIGHLGTSASLGTTTWLIFGTAVNTPDTTCDSAARCLSSGQPRTSRREQHSRDSTSQGLQPPSLCPAHALTPAGRPAPPPQSSPRGFHSALMRKTKPKPEALCNVGRRFPLSDRTEPPQVVVPGQHGGQTLGQAPSEWVLGTRRKALDRRPLLRGARE